GRGAGHVIVDLSGPGVVTGGPVRLAHGGAAVPCEGRGRHDRDEPSAAGHGADQSGVDGGEDVDDGVDVLYGGVMDTRQLNKYQ
ncbi:hypothetical protein CH063_11439, partial [Colletotrichum higginsianum]